MGGLLLLLREGVHSFDNAAHYDGDENVPVVKCLRSVDNHIIKSTDFYIS